jgi:hypothetical protein
MPASSTTGTGQGFTPALTNKELTNIRNQNPQIVLCGYAESLPIENASPPAEVGYVYFPYSLVGDSTHYVVMLTTIRGGNAYVVEMYEETDGDSSTGIGSFSGFSLTSEEECDVMYMVVKI